MTAAGNIYDDALRQSFARSPSVEPRAIYDQIAIEDVRNASDVLRPVYEAIAPVASLFVSCVDTQVDKDRDSEREGDVPAIREIFDGREFAALRRRGARAQRPLWASFFRFGMASVVRGAMRASISVRVKPKERRRSVLLSAPAAFLL